MTDDLAWLAAVLKPRDVAPHPNFMSRESITGPGLLALLAMGRRAEFVRLVDPKGNDPWGNSDGWIATSATEADLLRAADKALSLGTVRVGAVGLRNAIVHARFADSAAMTAACLLAAVAFAEVEDYDACFDVIDTGLALLGRRSDSDGLCRAALALQRGLRQSDLGVSDGVSDARTALGLLRATDVAALPAFQLSRGVSWASDQTLEDIKESLEDAAAQALTRLTLEEDESTDGDWFSWEDRVREMPRRMALLDRRDVATGYENFVHSLFNDMMRGTTRGESVFRGGSLEESRYLFAAELADELSGRRTARHSRRRLAEYQMVRATPDTGVDEIRDVLRLLRHSSDMRPLIAALNWVRAKGPLQALQADAEVICQYRLELRRLRVPELRVLHVGAQLLSIEDARRATNAVLASIAADVPAILAGRDLARSARLEPAWLAAASLGAVAGLGGRVAEALLEAVKMLPEDDDLLGMAMARAMREMAWADVSAEIKNRWLAWLEDGPRVHRSLREQAASSLDVTSPAVVETQLSLADIAHGLNVAISGGSLPREWVVSAVPIVRQAMRSIGENARAGLYSRGGVDAADVAVGLATYVDAHELWPDIVDFLRQPGLQRADTASAFDRLAAEASRVPPLVGEGLSTAADLLLFHTKDIFGSDVTPYPAALRCLAALQVIDSETLLTYAARLAGVAGATGRHEAARLVTSACRRSNPASWVRALALNFSYDPAPEVRAEAGRSLALLLQGDDGGRDLVEERLDSLLEEDGLLVPTLTLRGLYELRLGLPLRTRQAVSALSNKHPARSIRKIAAEVLSAAPA